MTDYTNPNEFLTDEEREFYEGLSDEERMKAGCFQLAAFFVMIMVGLALCALFGSCTTTKYVPVPEYHTDTLRISHNTRDSIYVHDSTYIKEKGDTMLIERWHTKYIEKQVHDTTHIVKIDTVDVPCPVETIKEVPAKLTWWEQTRLHIANILLWLLLILTIGWLIKNKLLP